MMPKTKTITTYSFEELSDTAKDRARDWWREHDTEPMDTDFLYDDFTEVAKRLGINIGLQDSNPRGRTIWKPKIFWSGFHSQGDGACFEGVYRYAPKASAKVREHASQDTTLHDIADRLTAIQRDNLFGLRAVVTHLGRYYHENSVEIDISNARYEPHMDYDIIDANALAECLRDFMRWMYRQLENEYDYRTSDEYVDEAIICNEYEFDEEGNLA